MDIKSDSTGERPSNPPLTSKHCSDVDSSSHGWCLHPCKSGCAFFLELALDALFSVTSLLPLLTTPPSLIGFIRLPVLPNHTLSILHHVVVSSLPCHSSPIHSMRLAHTSQLIIFFLNLTHTNHLSQPFHSFSYTYIIDIDTHTYIFFVPTINLTRAADL